MTDKTLIMFLCHCPYNGMLSAVRAGSACCCSVVLVPADRYACIMYIIIVVEIV